MARHRIEDIDDVRQLDKDPNFQRVHAKNVNTDAHVGPRPVHSVAGTGMNGVQVDIQGLLDTERELGDLHDDLVEQRNQATVLTGPLPDGQSPVAEHMRRAFFERADLDGGLQRILDEYLYEIFAVRQAILQTLNSYQAMDNYAAERLRQHAADLAHEEEDR